MKTLRREIEEKLIELEREQQFNQLWGKRPNPFYGTLKQTLETGLETLTLLNQ